PAGPGSHACRPRGRADRAHRYCGPEGPQGTCLTDVYHARGCAASGGARGASALGSGGVSPGLPSDVYGSPGDWILGGFNDAEGHNASVRERQESAMTTESSGHARPMSPGDGALHTAGAPRTTGTRFDPRTRQLLEAPITGTLLRLATPNVLVMIVQASVGLIETYFIGKLGTEALAGVGLGFPVGMLMQVVAAGAMGGGISSAIARALGAGRRADADALVLHALAISVAFGLGFMLAVLGGGRWLYGTLGGSGTVLIAALTYSNVVFAGALLVWIFNALANVIRGTGNLAIPALVTCVGAAVLIPVSPCLIFGWGPCPRLGLAGGAV